MGRRRRRRVGPIDDWEQLELLCAWEEQKEYEKIRPLELFGEPVPERSSETEVSERTHYRKIAAFREGVGGLFALPKAKRRVLPPTIRRKIVDLKAEHPAEPGGDRNRLRHPLRPQARRPNGEGRVGEERDPPQAPQALSRPTEALQQAHFTYLEAL